jgi:hypothetical protein
MATVLVVRKPDRTIHQMPIANKAIIMGFSNRLPAAQQYKFEEMDEEEAAKLPYIDPDYVTASDARDKIKEKDKELADKDAQLKALEEKLALLSAGATNTGSSPDLNKDDVKQNQPLSEGKTKGAK